MVNGALKMKHLYKALCGALLVVGLANIVPTPASAGTYYDSVCNCRRPDSEYSASSVHRLGSTPTPATSIRRGK